MATEDGHPEMLRYLREHVAYERTMLGYTYARLHDTAPGIAWNVVYESFGIHARNLYDFLRNDGNNTTFRADDYIASWPKAKPFLSFNELDAFLFHMSTKRAQYEKMNLGLLQNLGIWLDENWAKWVSRLPKPYTGILSPDAVCSMPLTLMAGVSQATACSAFSAMSTTIGVSEYLKR